MTKIKESGNWYFLPFLFSFILARSASSYPENHRKKVSRNIQKIESLIRECVPIPQKIYNITKKRLKTSSEEVEKYFPGFIGFRRFYRTTDTKTYRQKKT